MSEPEQDRLDVFGRVGRGEMTVKAAADLLGLSLRQARRIWRRFQDQGRAGLVHRLRGRRSNRRFPEEFRMLVVKRHQERYWDFGPTFACEKLHEEGLILSPDTLTSMLKERGLWVRRRRRGQHRSRRERKQNFGMMVQMDGSVHDWFEERGERCVLMVVVDDATSQTFARFYPAESLDAAFDVFGRWVKKHGLPRSVYVDRHSIYRDEDHPDRPTQFGRAMRELGVELILAHSPQAKGRVERRNGVLQDRLVKELRLRGISRMHQGNVFLEKYLPEFNRRFALKAAAGEDLHRRLPAGVILEEVLCVQGERVVTCDWCVRWQNRWLQISPKHESLELPRRRVLVKELSGGKLVVSRGESVLETKEIVERPRRERQRNVIVNNRRWTPAAEHPWRRSIVGPRVSPAPAAPARGLHAVAVT